MSKPAVLPLHIPEQTRANLEQLAAYLEGPLQENTTFTMQEYCTLTEELQKEVSTARMTISEATQQMTNCGSAGCALGHGPYAGLPKGRDESWTEYSNRLFLHGIDLVHKFVYEGRESAWFWCFGGSWGSTDNTALGAAKRIRWMLENNGLPENADEQRRGEAPLCYLDA